MNLYKHSQLISFINRRKNPYAVKRQMTNYMLQDDEKHQKVQTFSKPNKI
ncbi:unnamed protein product [Brassica rapa subsp. trilocularis]|uniref:(rape) hypothetical protein n=1 Tax=Brassica napus TaxID=3708 RepID=A0A816P2M4_BRANA|nr:unnamed protein product [Brassica napus]